MNQQLLYAIAGHRMLIETPDAEMTAKLLPSFDPFRVDSDGKNDVLFQFSGNTDVSIPDSAPHDVMEADGMSFDVYHAAGSVTVCVTKGDKKHCFNLSADRTAVISDLTLTE